MQRPWAGDGTDRQFERLTRLYAAISQINRAIVRLPGRDELFRQACQILVKQGGFSMAWIGWHDSSTSTLQPVASWGDDAGVLGRITFHTDRRLEDLGTSGRAFRDGQPAICNDGDADRSVGPCLDELRRSGFHASAAVPIRAAGAVVGTLNVYANAGRWFEEQELALLVEAAGDLSVAIDNLAREQDLRSLDAAVSADRLFSDTMIESMPGIVYAYDEGGHFLRVNRNFLSVSGYTAEETARLHPLDFFADDDRALVAARIHEVFTEGEASVEAALLTKSGRAIPYLFTGRRVIVKGMPCLVGIGVDVADRVAARQQRIESERKYRELVELANSIILRWDAAGRITFLNEFGQRFFGYREDEIIGREAMGTIVPATESSGRDLAALMARVRADPAAFEQNVNENVRRSGERVWIAWSNRVVKDANGDVTEILSVGSDITARRRIEEALRLSEERYRTTLESILEGCQLIGFDWRYLYLNGAAEVQNRRPNRELLGRMMQEAWLGIEGTDVFRLLRACMEDRQPRHAEVEFVFPDGTAGWFDVRCQAAPEGIFVLSIDITERKAAERALRDLNEGLEQTVSRRTEELRDALVRAEAADRTKSAFLATMSHELRTPLNSIIGFTGIVLQGLAGPLTAEQTKQLGMVRSSARHLLELINDVLDLSKIEAGQMEVQCAPFDLPASLDRVIQSVMHMAERKALQLHTTRAPELQQMTGDRRRVEQVLLNLLNNAIKFTDVGQVELTAEIVSATGELDESPQVRLRVSDTGIGISGEDLATLFQPFRQLDTGLSRQHEGTGLGLAVCRRLAGLMGGEITAQSEPGKGSVFTVVLPLKRGVSR